MNNFKELLEKFPMDRENMTLDQEKEFVNHCFDLYEKEGFSKILISPFDLGEMKNRQGTPFKVLSRIRPLTELDNGDDTADLETLPLWKIQFEDGETMIAYPEEIIKSEIENNIWRESDKKYLNLM